MNHLFSVPISHTLLITYIQALGWIEVEKFQRKIIYGKENNYLHIPIEKLADYDDVMYDLIDKISDVEEIPIEKVVENIIFINYDKKYMKIPEIEWSNNRFLKFEDAVILLGNFKKSLAYTAASVISPKNSYIGSFPEKVSKFISDTIIGHTQKGSFIFPIYTSIQPKFLNKLDENPFNRMAGKKSYEAISLLANSLNQSDHKTLIDPKNKDHGISANLIETFINIFDRTPLDKIEIHYDWALTRPEDTTSPHVLLSKEYAEPMREAVEVLKNIPEKKRISVYCDVKMLNNDSQHNKTIKLITEFDKKLHTLIVEEPQEDFMILCTEAYREDKYIKCSGDLERMNNKFYFGNIDDYSLSEEMSSEYTGNLF